MPGHIEMKWRECAKLLAGSNSPEQLVVAKSLFFSGALACFQTIGDSARDSGQVGASMVMLAIHGEICEFQREIQAMKDGRFPGGD